jgi:hypothetical protein
LRTNPAGTFPHALQTPVISAAFFENVSIDAPPIIANPQSELSSIVGDLDFNVKDIRSAGHARSSSC